MAIFEFYMDVGGLGPTPLDAARHSVQKLTENSPISLTATHFGSLYYFGCKSCPVGCKSCPVGCKSCRRVKVGRARNTPHIVDSYLHKCKYELLTHTYINVRINCQLILT